MAAFTRPEYFEGLKPNMTQIAIDKIKYIVANPKPNPTRNSKPNPNRNSKTARFRVSNKSKGVVKSFKPSVLKPSSFSNVIRQSLERFTSLFNNPNNSSIALFISSHGEDQENSIISNILKNYTNLTPEKDNIIRFVQNSVNAVVVTPQVMAPMDYTFRNNISSSRADVVLIKDLYRLFNNMYPDLAIDKHIRLRLFTLARLLLRKQFSDLHNPPKNTIIQVTWLEPVIKLIKDKNIWKQRAINANDANNTPDRMYSLRPDQDEGPTDCIYGINVLDLRDAKGNVAKLDDGRTVLTLTGNIIGLNRILYPIYPKKLYYEEVLQNPIIVQHHPDRKKTDAIYMHGDETHFRFIDYIEKILPNDNDNENNRIKRKIVYYVLEQITKSQINGNERILLSDIMVLCYCLNLQPYIFDPACRPIQNGSVTRSGTEYSKIDVEDEWKDTQDTHSQEPYSQEPYSQPSGGTKTNKSLHKRKLSKRKTRKLYRSQKHKQT